MDFHLTLTGLSALRRNRHPIRHTKEIIAQSPVGFKGFKMFLQRIPNFPRTQSQNAGKAYIYKTKSPRNNAQPCNTQCCGCASNSPLAHPARRAEDARSASAGPGARSEYHSCRNTPKRSAPSPKAACGIVAAAASRPHPDQRTSSRPQPRVQGRSPGQEGVRGVQRGLGGRLTSPDPFGPPGGKITMHIENTYLL